jgi:hypothetical protein
MNNRVHYFINNGIFESEDYTFIIICNDQNIDFDCPSYVKILKRDNIGYDFGGWSDGLLNDDLYKHYDKFIFINSSCIGPFTPTYYNGNWCDIFTNRINNDIKLFGTMINTMDNVITKSHIQSWIFCTDRKGLDVLISNHIFSRNYELNFIDTINNREIRMSRVIINNGWNIASLMLYYNNIDFRFKDKQPLDYNVNFLGNVVDNNLYFGCNLHPYEVIFVKANRGVNVKWLDVYLKKSTLNNTITKAIYGYSTNKYIDVTNIVNSFVGKTFKISNEYFGDPFPGSLKNLIILDNDDNIIVNWEHNYYNPYYISNSQIKIQYKKILMSA